MSEFISEPNLSVMKKNTRLLDDYFRDSFEKSMVGPRMGISKNPYVIIALGGYGRQEQCIHSDVDILFLFKKEIPERAEALIREIIFPLWDIGMDIGHATRSLKECVGLAGKDFEVLMSVLDARFICGMSPLYSELMGQLRQKIIFRRSNKITDWLVRSNRERHRAFGDSACLLEPNLKEGRGGLRDYHTMLWLAKIRFGLEKPRDLEYQGYLSHAEYRSMGQALAFIRKTRNGLHILTCRKYDQLHFEHQLRLAGMFGYPADGNQQGVEKFLTDLHGHMNVIRQNHLMFLHELGKTHKWFDFKKPPKKQPRSEGLAVKKEALTFTSPEAILENPLLLLRIFEESARLKMPLKAEARRLIRDFSDLAGTEFRALRESRKIFERILALRAPDEFSPLSEMLNTGFLVRFIPEMTGVVNRTEYDTYHVYPVDRHLVRTVRAVRQFGTTDDMSGDRLCGDLYREIRDRTILLWAALLHDIGKGRDSEDHSRAGAEMALTALGQRKYGAGYADTVSFLVREHLLLIRTATRRDIDEAETVLSCARKVQTPERLRMLYLLSVADLIATGPKAWSEWTAILLRDLFLRVMKVMAQGDPVSQDAVSLTQKKTDALLAGGDWLPAETDLPGLFNVMSPRYLLSTPVSEMQTHIRLHAGLKGAPFVWQIEQDTAANTRKVTVCGQNVPGSFSKVAGVLALNRVHILDAQVHTWRNNIALSIFRVTPPPDLIFENERWERAERELRSALAGELDIACEMAERIAGDAACPVPDLPPRVNVDNLSSGFFTIIEIFTRDLPGLLFRLSDALFRCRLDIRSAQIATTASQVVDVFYVRDFDGRKVDSPDRIRQIRAAIDAVLREVCHADARDRCSPEEAVV
ncbi:[protein-PII] uridylyltransferase [Desulfonema ishimotonii]|nr:[protein-PII] uridylyltransferase [Desulfonema ishimotonii]